MQAVLDRDASGRLVRLAGVMAMVRTGATVRPGDAIAGRLPAHPHRPLEPVSPSSAPRFMCSTREQDSGEKCLHLFSILAYSA